jgi:hypothetical protein
MKKISQGMPPMGMMGAGAEPGGLPGMPTLPMAGGAAGAEAPPQPVNTFNVIHSPLDSLGKILADVDIKSFLENNFGGDPDKLAHKIWVMYGGSENELEPGKKGARQDTPHSNDMAEQDAHQNAEYNATRNSRWKRLPAGVSIDQITNTQAISNTIAGGLMLLSKEYSKPPAEAVSIKELIKIANIADNTKDYSFADYIDYILINVYPSR